MVERLETFEEARLKMLRTATRKAALDFIKEWASNPADYQQAVTKTPDEILLHVHIACVEHPEITAAEKEESHNFLSVHQELWVRHMDRLRHYRDMIGSKSTWGYGLRGK